MYVCYIKKKKRNRRKERRNRNNLMEVEKARSDLVPRVRNKRRKEKGRREECRRR